MVISTNNTVITQKTTAKFNTRVNDFYIDGFYKHTVGINLEIHGNINLDISDSSIESSPRHAIVLGSFRYFIDFGKTRTGLSVDFNADEEYSVYMQSFLQSINDVVDEIKTSLELNDN